MVDNSLSDEQMRLLLSDSEIDDLIVQLKRRNQIPDDENLLEFLKKLNDIFFGNEIYMIKICRILLEESKPTGDEMDELSSNNEESAEITRSKLEKFKNL